MPCLKLVPKSVVEKMLPVVDNLERGFDGLSDEEKETPFAKGMEAVYKQLITGLEEIGVTPIEAVGKEFDPNLHNAVMHDEDDSEASNRSFLKNSRKVICIKTASQTQYG